MKCKQCNVDSSKDFCSRKCEIAYNINYAKNNPCKTITKEELSNKLSYLLSKKNCIDSNKLYGDNKLVIELLKNLYYYTNYKLDYPLTLVIKLFKKGIIDQPKCPVCGVGNLGNKRNELKKFCSKDCLKKHLSGLDVSLDTKFKISEKVKAYNKNKTNEQKEITRKRKSKALKKYISNLKECNIKKWSERNKKISEGVLNNLQEIKEKQNNYFKNRTEKEIKESRIRNRKNAKKLWKKLNDEEKEEFVARQQEIRNSKSKEEKKQIYAKLSESLKAYYRAESKEAKYKRIKRLKELRNNWTTKQRNSLRSKCQKKAKEYWNSLSANEMKKVSLRLKEAYWRKTEHERKEIALKIKERWSKKTPLEKKKIKDKIREAHFKKSEEELEQIKQKTYKTKKKNNSFNSSKPEIDLFNYLKHYYTDIKSQYRSELYPFNCDYYIPSLDLYIELQGSWTHGDRPFLNSKDDMKKLGKLIEKAEKSDYYKSAVLVWAFKDVKKRKIAQKNNLNYLEVYDYSDFDNVLVQIRRVIEGLRCNYNKKALENNLEFIKNSKGVYNLLSNNNVAIKHFQYKEFFKKEIDIYKNNIVKRSKLITNRIKYLNRPERNLTDKEILQGFKISGIHYGFSHFNPLIIKKFIEEYKPKTILDICGGWGHRLLGSLDHAYIYNDLNNNVMKNCKEMTNFFNLKNKNFLNEDCSSYKFKNNLEYDCVFTCPPYFNLENYESINFENDLGKWLSEWWLNSVDNVICDNLKLFAYVINENLMQPTIEICIKLGLELDKKIELFKNTSHLNKYKINKEYLVVLSNN